MAVICGVYKHIKAYPGLQAPSALQIPIMHLKVHLSSPPHVFPYPKLPPATRILFARLLILLITLLFLLCTPIYALLMLLLLFLLYSPCNSPFWHKYPWNVQSVGHVQFLSLLWMFPDISDYFLSSTIKSFPLNIPWSSHVVSLYIFKSSLSIYSSLPLRSCAIETGLHKTGIKKWLNI